MVTHTDQHRCLINFGAGQVTHDTVSASYNIPQDLIRSGPDAGKWPLFHWNHTRLKDIVITKVASPRGQPNSWSAKQFLNTSDDIFNKKVHDTPKQNGNLSGWSACSQMPIYITLHLSC